MAVVLETPKVAVSLGPLGMVAGVQLVAVFQSPLVGLRFQVALPAWLDWMLSSSREAGRILATNVALKRRVSASGLHVVGCVFIGLLSCVRHICTF